MTGHDHPEAIPLRTRTLHTMILDDDAETLITVEHVYLPEGAAGPCRDCGKPAHDPGMVGLAVGDGLALLDAEQALVLANRITKAAELVLQSEEDVPDIEREAARFGAPAEPGTAQPEGEQS
jgi:hypothetical protein